jgi:hypothetical protein
MTTHNSQEARAQRLTTILALTDPLEAGDLAGEALGRVQRLIDRLGNANEVYDVLNDLECCLRRFPGTLIGLVAFLKREAAASRLFNDDVDPSAAGSVARAEEAFVEARTLVLAAVEAISRAESAVSRLYSTPREDDDDDD